MLAIFMSNAGGAWDNAKNILKMEITVEKEMNLIKQRLLGIQ